jgi:VWFA-related protein
MRVASAVTTTVLVLGIGAAGPAAIAQEAQFAGEATVNVIEVPVRVIDPGTGRPVTGLSAKDFRIYENGRKQKITHFTEISRPQGGADGSTGPAAATDRTLEMVYFLDLFLMRKGGRDQALDALHSRYSRPLAPDEEVSIVVFDGSLRIFVDRSTNRTEILDALDAIDEVRARGSEHESAFTQALSDGPVTGTRDRYFYERKQRSEEYIVELERRVAKVGGAISATMARYARADARKILVVFTPGHPRTRWVPEYSPVDFINQSADYPTKGLWQNLSYQASDLGFTLFTIDSAGIQPGVEGDVSQASTTDIGVGADGQPGSDNSTADDFAFGAGSPPESIGPWLERVRKDLLISAAANTGGSAHFSNATAAVENVTASLDHYYSLAYVAKHSGDGETYSIRVELPKHPEYETEFRRAYVDRPAAERSATRLQSAMLFGGDANPLAIRVELGEPKKRLRIGAAGSKMVRLPIKIKIPIGRLELIPQGKIFWGKVAVTVFGEDAAGNQSQPVGGETPISIPMDQIQQARARGYFSYDLTVEVEGGQQKVWIGVEDLISGRISIMPQELDF